MLKRSNDKGSQTAGVKLIDSNSLFLMNFYSYDKLTHDPDVKVTKRIAESLFIHDQLVNKQMVRDMGRGVKDVEVIFENPIIVTSRQDEHSILPEHFTRPDVLV